MTGPAWNLDELRMVKMSSLGTFKMNEHLSKFEKATEEEFAYFRLNEKNLVILTRSNKSVTWLKKVMRCYDCLQNNRQRRFYMAYLRFMGDAPCQTRHWVTCDMK